MAKSAFRYLMAPWWLLSLATGAKSFRDNPIIGSRRLNDIGLHTARVRLAHKMASFRRKQMVGMIGDADRAAFDRDGFVIHRNFLPQEDFDALKSGIEAWRGPARDMRQGDAITRRFAIDPAMLKAVPALHTLLRHPDWRGLTRYVSSYNLEPLTYIQTVLARQAGKAPDPQQTLHIDSFQPSMKAWFFLDDVAEDEGPFTYVPGSHKLTDARLAWEREVSLDIANRDRLSMRGSFRIERAELPKLDLPEPRACAVPANTLVVADTFGIHARGPSLHPGRRVEIWAYSRHNPFLPWKGIDLIGIPGIAERRVNAYWRGRDMLSRFIGQPWNAVGDKGPFEL